MALPKMLRYVPNGKPVSRGSKVLFHDAQWSVERYNQSTDTVHIERDGKTAAATAYEINCYWLKH